MVSIASTMPKDVLVEKWAYMGAGFSFLFILAVTFYPYNFSIEETAISLGHNILIVKWGESNYIDILKNVLLFLLIGFSFTGYLTQKRRLTGLVALLLIFLLSFGLSYIIEVLQVFLPSRISSFIDVFSNISGALLGFLCFRLWKYEVKVIDTLVTLKKKLSLRLFGYVILVFLNILGVLLGFLCFRLWEYEVKVIDYTSAFIEKNLPLSFLGYAILVILILISFQKATSLSNWDENYTLLLGNEQTGDRPWRGYVSELHIADRALSKKEVMLVFSGEKRLDFSGDSLLASYRLTGSGSYHDKTGHLPDLVWRGSSVNVRKYENAITGSAHWLETTAPAGYLTDRITETSQFTLYVTMSSHDTTQVGPARIVSFSKDHGHRNFTLGQLGKDLVFRLRTPITGKNGRNPQFIVPDVFSVRGQNNVIITYDGTKLNLYVDGLQNAFTLALDPAGISFDYIFQKNVFKSAEKAFYFLSYKCSYYAGIFIPLGILLSVSMKRMRGRLFIRIMLFGACVILTAYLFENVLTIIQHRNMRMENLILGVLFMAAFMMFYSYMQQRAAKQ